MILSTRASALCACLLLALTSACFPFRASRGGGQTEFEGPRRVDAGDVAVVAG
jgi:hypothetical protein